MSHVSFDGPNKIIQCIVAPVGGYAIMEVPAHLYSEWKEWVQVDNNSKYLQAMYSVGGEPLPGGKYLGATFFLINDWKMRPYEATHTLTLEGNLFCDDGSSPFVPTVGTYNVQVIMTVSNLTTALETGVSGLTTEESDKLLAIPTNPLTVSKFLALK